jgi:hypothetical protein
MGIEQSSTTSVKCDYSDQLRQLGSFLERLLITLVIRIDITPQHLGIGPGNWITFVDDDLTE